MTNHQPILEDEKVNDSYLEYSLDRTDKLDVNGIHMSETLRSMPDPPTPEDLAQSVLLTESEKTQNMKQAISVERFIILASLIYVLPAIGQGFDSGTSSIAVNMPAFLIKFGAYNETTATLYVPSLWLALWNASSSLGNAIGSLITGALTDRFGYRNAQVMGCVWSFASVFLQVFAVNREMILVGKLLNGISMGMFVAISAGYISEVTGPKTRATLMSVLAAFPIIGIIAAIAIGSTDAVIGNLNDWGSRKLMFALQWVLPTLSIPLVLSIPESPTQLVKRNHPQAALAALRRFRRRESEEYHKIRLAGTQLSVATSIDEAKAQSCSYIDCFKGVDRKRTITVIVMFCGTQFAGVQLLSNGLYFLEQTGIAFATVSAISEAFLGVSAVVCVGTSVILNMLGRRNTLVYGSFMHGGLLVLLGALYYAKSKSGLLATAILFNLAISSAQFASGAPVYALSVEISSVRLRSKTQSLGLAAYYVFGWVFSISVPYMFQVAPEGAGWEVRTCWLFAGLTFLFAIFGYFQVPETKGRSYADIDELYRKNISPRHFASQEVHAERDAVA